MPIVNIHDAKTHLSRLIDQALAGEEVVIAKAGKPVVRLIPEQQSERRVPGIAKGKVTDAFFDPLPNDEVAAWDQ